MIAHGDFIYIYNDFYYGIIIIIIIIIIKSSIGSEGVPFDIQIYIYIITHTKCGEYMKKPTKQISIRADKELLEAARVAGVGVSSLFREALSTRLKAAWVKSLNIVDLENLAQVLRSLPAEVYQGDRDLGALYIIVDNRIRYLEKQRPLDTFKEALK